MAMMNAEPQDAAMETDASIQANEYGFDEEFINPPPEVYECPICLLVVNEPMQTVCGHRFCKRCILKVIQEGRPQCPIDNHELDETQIFPDNFARREINLLNVRCRNNKDNGCKWIGTLKNLKKHLENCDYNVVSCSNNCGEDMIRLHLNEHLDNVCERRIASCEHCAMKVVYKQLAIHLERCAHFPVECPNLCGKVPRDELTEHLSDLCPNANVKCSYRDLGCSFEGSRQGLKEHVATAGEVHSKCMSDSIRMLKQTQDQQGQTLQNINAPSAFARLTSGLLDLESQVDKLKETNIAVLEGKMEQVTKIAKDNEKLVQEVNARVWNGSIIWKINDLAELFQKAKNGETPAIHSFPFYTSVPGYKMCIRVNLNGIDSGENTHVSMFVHLMQGEYDSIVQWPFPGNVVLTVIDQSNDTPGKAVNVIERLNAKPNLQAFRRPQSLRNNKGYGFVEMISHEKMKSRGYTKDDCMIVKVDAKVP